VKEEKRGWKGGDACQGGENRLFTRLKSGEQILEI